MTIQHFWIVSKERSRGVEVYRLDLHRLDLHKIYLYMLGLHRLLQPQTQRIMFDYGIYVTLVT